VSGSVIDSCVFHDWESASQLFPYLSDGWRDTVERPGDLGGMLNPNSSWLYPEPSLDQEHPRSSWSFRDYESLRTSLLDSGQRDKVVLGHFDNLLTTASPYHYLASALVTATNDWTIKEWLERDDRVFGMMLVYAGLPDHAAAEIRRAGRHDQMVAVALGANGLSNLFGHPVYHPIYEAAAELSLPLVIQVGSDSAVDLQSDPVAGGLPTTFGEYRALSVHALMTHLASMITEGVFEKYPNLNVLVLGGGLTWVAPYLWRIGYWFKSLEREAPWLKTVPATYFTDHVRLATYSMETIPSPEALTRAISVIPGIEGMIAYASGAPSTEAQDLDDVLSRFPESWHENIMHNTAEQLFRWPDREPAVHSGDQYATSRGEK
jgi:uncharacterized protein